ncbi:MAG: glycosyl hydrolase family 65 protein, partial [Methylocystis sp.]
GVHIAALGGIWLMVVFGFAGVSLSSDGMAIDPRLPAHWRSVGFRLQWCGRHVKIKIDQDNKRLEVTLETGEPMTLLVNSDPHEVRRDQILRLRLGV